MQESKKPFHVKLKIILPILLFSVSLIIIAAAILFFINKRNNPESHNVDNPSSLTTESSPQQNIPVSKRPITKFKSLTVTSKNFISKDIPAGNELTEAKKIIDNIKNDGFDSIELYLNHENGLLFSSDTYEAPYGDILKDIYTYCRENNITLITSLNIRALYDSNANFEKNQESIISVLGNKNLTSNTDMLVLRNNYISSDDITETEFKTLNLTISYEQHLKDELNTATKNYYEAVKKSNPTLYFGTEINEIALPENSIFTPQIWLADKTTDFVIICNGNSTELEENNFSEYFNSLKNGLTVTDNIFIKLSYNKIGSDEKGWEMTDQILRQLQELENLSVNGFILDSYNSYINDKTESRNAVIKFLQNQWADDYILRELNISRPEKSTFKTSDNTVLLAGASDPSFKLTLNGEELERSDMGYFSTDLKLKLGLNTFKIEHKGVVKTYKITFEREIIKEYFPSEGLTLPSESTIFINCVGASNSKVTASLGEITVNLTEEPIKDANGIKDEQFSNYTGQMTLPLFTDKDTDYGKISFTVNSEYGSVTKKSGNIIIEKADTPDIPTYPSIPDIPSSSDTTTGSNTPSSSNPDTSSDGSSNNTSQTPSNSTSTYIPSNGAPTGGDAWVKPSDGKYVDVGTSYIAEVENWQGETFSSTDGSDYSRPTNNYLPKGTVDYCSSSNVYSSGGYMKTLRYGNRLYTTSSKGQKILNIYKGTLPDHNTIGVAGVTNTGRHTLIVLDTLWKAPFRFDLKPQSYKNESASSRDYTITSATYSYIDITFCYTTLVAGDVLIPESDPVFSRAEWIKNSGDYTLRLYLKQTGKFYGWSAEYNEQGQLVFSFLNPAKITAADNSYGYRLDGIIVAIDVGHGGKDIGAQGSNNNYHEAQLNLILANKLKAELESLGAYVVMTRYDNNSNPSSDTRMKLLRDYKVDYCIAIHRNSSDSSNPRAFNSYHFNAFSSEAAKLIYKATSEYSSNELTAIYNSSNPFHGDGKLYKETKWSGTKWHYFYTARQTDCPVVLTENGFISNNEEYSDMIRDDFNSECAKALTKGIVEYFKSIQ